MLETVPDEAFARAASEVGAVTFDHLEAARQIQAEAARQGQRLALADALIRQGVISPIQRETIEKKAEARQTGGIKQLGPYKLLKKLGEGGMGAVYLADDTSVGRKVAVKVLPKKYSEEREFLTRFRREAQATGKLNHVNIVIAYNVGEEAGTHYYAMEYCEGDTLDRILKRDKVIPWDAAVGIVLQVARGLKHAHDHGIIHRDIKPANIFVCKPLGTPESAQVETFAEGFVAKILDLGLSKNIRGDEQSFYTQTGVALGTPHYISPEQARGEKGIDGRTDIYSLGATFYHLVTGQTPFSGTTAGVIMMKHLNEQLTNPQDINEDIPDGVAQIIAKMMAKEPADRYANCKELLDDLELVIDGKTPSSNAIDAGKSSVAVARVAQLRKLRHERGTRRHEPVAQVRNLRHERGTGSQQQTEAASGTPTPVGKYVAIGVAVLGALVLAVALGVRASRERAAEQARAAEEARVRQEADARQRLEDQYQAALNEARRELQGEAALAGYYLGLDAAKARRIENALARALAAKPGDAAVKALQATLVPPRELALDLGGGVKMELVLIKAGEFMMGADNEGGNEEKPAHKVRIGKPFYMGKYEVTQPQYERVMGTNPSQFKGTDLPVERVSWNDATVFCKLLSEQTGKTVVLPTEAQWEYACRAGTTTRYNTGDKDSDLEQEGWFNKNSGGKTNGVGQKKPNAWGLCDMHGNVWEWVQDYFSDKYYSESPAVDPQGPATGGDRVLRGGCWNDGPAHCRSARRYGHNHGYRGAIFGFRVVVGCGSSRTP